MPGVGVILRTECPQGRDLPKGYGPIDLVRPFRSLPAGWLLDRIMEGPAAAYDEVAVQVIVPSVVRAHQHGSCIASHRPKPAGESWLLWAHLQISHLYGKPSRRAPRKTLKSIVLGS
jgi:hypothetical protein